MEHVVIDTALGMWNLAIKRASGVLASLSDEALLKEVAPNRNRAIYLMGHLTTVNDGMIPLLRLGERLYPSLGETFFTRSDKEVPLPGVGELRNQWQTVNAALGRYFAALEPNEWLERHSNVSEEEFVSSPGRSRLSILLNRTNHVSLHIGQLIFLMPTGTTRAER